MIKLFSGKDQHESYTKARKDAESICTQLSANLKIYNAKEVTSLENFVQELEGIDIFSTASVFFIKRISENKDIQEYITSNYDSLKGKDIILWEDSNADGRTKLTQLLKKDGALFNYEELKDRDFRLWIKEEARKDAIQLTEKQIDLLLEHSELNKGILKNELVKIKLFLTNKNLKNIDDSQLDEILGYNVKGNIWKFLDYFGNRKSKNCIAEFKKLTAFEDNSQYLIAMLSRELGLISQILYVNKNSLDTKLISVHPFVLKKTIEKAKNFKWSEIKMFTKKLLDLDFAIKRGDIDEKIGLMLYLLSL